uniref:Uncharacterized protein n=1 Tax=Romanomermis culicivorax TaxID=13658 RepID=A0A915HTT2_ROMCU
LGGVICGADGTLGQFTAVIAAGANNLKKENVAFGHHLPETLCGLFCALSFISKWILSFPSATVACFSALLTSNITCRLEARLYLPSTERNGTDQQLGAFSLKIHFRSERISKILRKTTDSNLQPNRTERKFPCRSVTFRRLHSVPLENA